MIHNALRSAIITGEDEDIAEDVAAIITELISENSDLNVNAVDNWGETSLHYAARFQTAAAIPVLVRAGGNTEAVESEGFTPLHLAVMGGHVGTVRALLEAGASVDARDPELRTPLHMACFKGDLSCVELLLEWGADAEVVDKIGRNAKERLQEYNESDFEHTYAGEVPYSTDEVPERDSKRCGVKDSISHVLERATADKHWRRRAWLVMMRGRHPRSDRYCDRNHPSKGEVALVARERAVESPPSWCSEEDDGELSLRKMVMHLVSLQDDGIFRKIIRFL
ncbi:unnamed protein product [Discosporangium mesarthrocarpum]